MAEEEGFVTQIATPEPVPQTFDAVLKESKIPLRSWRKKYRKLKLHFESVMEESNTLFAACHKLDSTVKRLQEETDQLMELLLDLNESGHTPSYELGQADEEMSPVPSASAVPALEPDVPRSLSSLLNIPHTRLKPETKLPSALSGEVIPGYLTTSYEEEYLNNLDSQIAADEILEDVHQPLRPAPSRVLPSEKDLLNSNPMSVLSWLRRHHPETFIQDKETTTERPAPRTKSGGGKRSSLAIATNVSATSAPSVAASTPGPKTEQDTADEELELEPIIEKVSGRKAKVKADEPYRPKGGSSKAKRKRDDGETPKGRGKRAKAATSAPS